MKEPKNSILASCATILIVAGILILMLFIVGAGILLFNLPAGS